jgi:hypothetical protein
MTIIKALTIRALDVEDILRVIVETWHDRDIAAEDRAIVMTRLMRDAARTLKAGIPR